MYKLKEIADKVYYVGVNDRQKALFENMWPLPYGVSYNSYLIVDEKTVLVDTVDVCYSDIFLKKIADALCVALSDLRRCFFMLIVMKNIGL